MPKISNRNALITSGDKSGMPAGKAVVCGQTTLDSASKTVATGLASVDQVVATLESSPVLTCAYATAQIGDQAGAPAAGSILLNAWMPTTADDTTPIAATGYASKKVNWIAFGTPA